MRFSILFSLSLVESGSFYFLTLFLYAFLRICVPLSRLRVRVSCSDTASQASSVATLKIAKIPQLYRLGDFFGSSYSLPFFLFFFRRQVHYIRFFYNAKYFLLLLEGLLCTRLCLSLYQFQCPDDISARVGDDDGRSLDEGISVVREGIDETQIAYLECDVALLEILEIDEIYSSPGVCILRCHVAIDRTIHTAIVI